MVRIAEGADAVVIGMTASVANLLTAMTRGMAGGMDEAHAVTLRDGPGAITDVTTTGAVIAGATIDFATRVGGPVTIDGEIMTGAIGGVTTGGENDETVAIDLCGVLKFGIVGDKLSQMRDVILVAHEEGVKKPKVA